MTVTVRSFNLEDLRVGAGHRRPARAPRRHVREIYARGLLDTLGDSGRDNLWRFASMVQRRGGETFLEFRTPRSRQRAQALRRAPAHLPRPGHRRARGRGARRHRRAPRDRPRPRPARRREPADLSTRREVDTMSNPIAAGCAARRAAAPPPRQPPATSPPASPRSRPPSRRTAGSTSGSPTSSTWSPRCWCRPLDRDDERVAQGARRPQQDPRRRLTRSPGG